MLNICQTLFSYWDVLMNKADRVRDYRLNILNKNLKLLVTIRSFLSCLYRCDEVQMLESCCLQPLARAIRTSTPVWLVFRGLRAGRG